MRECAETDCGGKNRQFISITLANMSRFFFEFDFLRYKVSRVETSQTPKIKVRFRGGLTFANGRLKKLNGHNTNFREQQKL